MDVSFPQTRATGFKVFFFPSSRPKSSQKTVWETRIADLVLLLEGQKGTDERKLENMETIIYNYGVESFEVKKKRPSWQNDPSTLLKSRRLGEVDLLVKERRQLLSNGERPCRERVGLDALQVEIKDLTKL